ncbi:MAG: helix-turn-helix transcriptional regulator [Trueperaceae bacterium]
MRRAAAVFDGHGERFVADSCEPLRAAAERGEVALQALSRGSYPGRPPAPGDAREARLKLRSNELLLAVFELLDGQDVALDRSLPSAQRSVEPFLAALADRCGERWRLRDMAEECGLGRSRLTHQCRQLTNVTPVEVRTHVRVRAAQRLLQGDTAGSISDVAYACGFESSQ